MSIDRAGCGCGGGEAGCGCDQGEGQGGCGQAAFPSNPATALNYHFGMLLGVEDLKAEQAFHIGQIDRHHRELHGSGVLRGLEVRYDPQRGELRVSPGFALDCQGRAIDIRKAQCLDLVTFVEQNRSRHPMLAGVEAGAGVDLDLVISAGACMERPVQSIAAECNGESQDLAYSRLTERPELDLVAVTQADPPPDALGDLLAAVAAGTYQPAPEEVEGQRLVALAKAAAQPGAGAAAAAAVARQALLVASLTRPAPDDGLVAGEGCHVLLARLIGVRRVMGDAGLRVEVAEIRCDLRPLALAHWALQPRRPWDMPPLPVLGPQVTAAALAGQVITLGFDRAVAGASLVPGAFQLTELTAAGLAPVAFALAPVGPVQAPTGATLTLAAPAQGRLRLVVRGTGDHPIVDAAFQALGQAPGLEGQNFTAIF